ILTGLAEVDMPRPVAGKELRLSVDVQQRPVCLVTGGARRLGAAIAARLAPRFDLAIHYRSSGSEAEQLASRLRGETGAVHLFEADLGNSTQVAALVPEIVRRMGRLDMVVCNASQFDFDTPSDFSPEATRQMLAVNLIAPMMLGRDLALHGSPQATLVHLLDSKVFSLTPDYFCYSM